MIQVTYDYFDINDGNAMTVEKRMAELLESLQNKNDYIVFNDGKTCHNEQELKNVLKEKGGIL